MPEMVTQLNCMFCLASITKLHFWLYLNFCLLINLSFARIEPINSGQLEGILTQKSSNWIDVKNDKGYVNRYLPHWNGKSPSRGGGFDAEMLEVISKLVVGNRVFLVWGWDGHLRIQHINVIVPTQRSGTFEGYLLDIGDRWIDLQNFDEGKPWRFYLPWSGGYPENGGVTTKICCNFFTIIIAKFQFILLGVTT